MKMPEFIKRMGSVDEECRVYIEDYVYSYLNGLRGETDLLPLRAALFGHVIKKDNTCCYLIYGACCVVEELEYGRNEEQVRKEFFEDYELIGYVNVNRSKTLVPGKDKGYFIFYESNEAMQNYMSFCYERKRKKKNRGREAAIFGHSTNLPTNHAWGEKIGHAKDVFGQIFTLACVFILAMAVCAINSYDKMNGFVEMTGAAIHMLEAEE